MIGSRFRTLQLQGRAVELYSITFNALFAFLFFARTADSSCVPNSRDVDGW